MVLLEQFIYPDIGQKASEKIFCDEKTYIIVGVIGKSSAQHCNKMEIFKNLPEYPSLGEKFLPGGGQEGRITFYVDNANSIVYLHFETTYDNGVMMKMLEQEEDFEHFVNFSTHVRTRFGRMLLFASQVCHIVVLVETQSAFDTTYLGLFRSLKVIREKFVLKFLPKFLKNSTAGGILGKEGRLCSPRFIFFFEQCPGECLEEPERLKKLEFEMEDEIYKMLRSDFIITNNCANSLFSIPRNKRFVFINTDTGLHSDPTVDALNLLMECINKPSGRNSSQEDEFDSIRPFKGFAKPLSAYSTPTREKAQRSFMSLIREHVQEALKVGFDDSMAKFRGKSHFSAPTARAWLETFQLLHKIFLDNPDCATFEANDADYRAYLDNFTRIMDIDERFFAECTEDGLEFATLHYHELLPHHYSRAFHEQKLQQSVDLFGKYARGPRKAECEAKLREVCEATWLSKQQCEEPSLSGNPCTLAKHTVTDPTQHSSGVVYVSTCNCGRTQGRREDPYTTKQANHDFYQLLSVNCSGCMKAEQFQFPVFQPSGVDFRAAEVVHGDLEELYSDESNVATQLTHNTHTDLSLKSLDDQAMDKMSQEKEDVQEIVVKVGESPEKILRQHSTTEYLPGMIHTQSLTGLLPQFPSWSLVCIGPSSIYSHISGLPEHTQSGFLSGANFLIPWDVHVRLEHSASWAASYEKNRPRKRNKHQSADSGVVFQLKIFVGCEYECPRGHRFIMASPDKILRGAGGSLAKDSGRKVVYNDMPLYFPCPCRAAKSLTAQLMRVHVVTPKAPVNVNLEPRVRIGAKGSGVTFTAGLSEPAKLSQSAYWILRLPYIYQGDDGPICPPPEVHAVTASAHGCLMAGMYGVTETEATDGDTSIVI